MALTAVRTVQYPDRVRIGYFDCFSGVSGDMVLGALVDAGLPVADLQGAIGALGVEGIALAAEKVTRRTFAATRVRVVTGGGDHPPRRLQDILRLIERSRLDPDVKADAARVFSRLAEAEAEAHGTRPDAVHFHEVGALDAIADIVGAAFGLRRLGLDEVVASPINTGSGTVEGAHGRMPVPAPGTARLLIGLPSYSSGIQAELATPTGTAILATLARRFGPLPLLEVRAVGYGAGARDLAEQPNVLRLLVGETDGAGLERDGVALVETNLDDMNPQFFEVLVDQLFAAGALDVWMTPITMKKSRPAVTLSVLCPTEAARRTAGLILE
ncbi:MAG TPA: nickel pincer cofactor biosynthesis protein LarC, partial [Candidatus Methylomirabilis sp.]